MKRIARKYFLPMLLGSALIFAIDIAEVNATPAVSITVQDTKQANTFIKLEDNGFWSKFRESVMKDKDNKEPSEYSESNPAPPRKEDVYKPARPAPKSPHGPAK